MTYEQLAKIINETFTEEQKKADVTVELLHSDECLSAKLLFADDIHETLDEYHPVLGVDW